MSAARMPQRVRDTLRCPRCGQTLRIGAASAECAGTDDAHRFPLVDGVPILLDESRSLFAIEDFLSGSQGGGRPAGLPRIARRILPSLGFNANARKSAEDLEKHLFATAREPLVLNIGGKHPDAAVRSVLRDPRVTCAELDVSLGPETQVVGEGDNLPFRDSVFDAVVIDAVLEHVPDPSAVVGEIHRVLQPDGVVYADTPFMLPVHGGAYDFGRFSAVAHRRLFHRFREIDSGVSGGPGSALAHSAQAFLLSFVAHRTARYAIKLLSSLTLFWLKYFDHLLVRKPGALDAALGVYFLGRKSADVLPDREVVRRYRGATPNLYRRGDGHTT